MATPDMQTAQDLEAAGAEPRLAAATAAGIARGRRRRRRDPSSISILTAANALGFVLVTAGMGWILNETRANRDRIDAVETRLSGEIQNVSERLTRIETLLDERFPARR